MLVASSSNKMAGQLIFIRIFYEQANSKAALFVLLMIDSK